MWEVRQSADDLSPAFLGNLAPREVLVDVDGPRIFTTLDAGGGELLAYQCAEDAEASRFLLVPTNEVLIQRLRGGQLSLRGALLSPPWIWLADLLHGGGIRAAWRVTSTDIPTEHLPDRWVGLLPEHEPWLGLRLVGPGLVEGATPASVVKRAVDGATKAMKSLTEHVLEIDAGMGRPTDWLRRLYDLPITSFAFSSFEVVFGSPSEPRLGELGLVDDAALRLFPTMSQRSAPNVYCRWLVRPWRGLLLSPPHVNRKDTSYGTYVAAHEVCHAKEYLHGPEHDACVVSLVGHVSLDFYDPIAVE
jgi:hypothetical protein